jgi:signal transduction histidine kinase
MNLRSLNLYQQGLILVAVPLVFEIVFVAILAGLLFQAEHKAKDLAVSRDIATEVSVLTKCFLDQGINLAAWKTTHNSRVMARYDNEVAKLPSIYARLTTLAAGDPSREEHVKALKRFGDKILFLTQSLRNPDASMLALMDPVSYRQEMSMGYEGLTRETQAVSQEETVLQAANPANEAKLRQSLEIALKAGIVMSIIFTLALSRFFSQRVVRRVEVMTDNSTKLANKEPLNPPVGGDDEISTLDRTFHQMADQLKNAEKRKQEYIQMINHDLRTPLASIQGTLAVASRGSYGALNEKGQKRINDAEQDAERLIGLINEMLDIERLESGNFDLEKTAAPIKTIVEQTFEAVRPLAESKGLTLASAGDELIVYADRDRLVRVLINLVGNAIKFSPSGTSITVSCAEDEKSVNIRVIDEGRGIPATAILHVFDRFKQVERADAREKGGSGLGLAICKAIIEAHGGQIGVHSAVGKGSTFWFTIPHQRLTST